MNSQTRNNKPQSRAINIVSGGIGNYPIKLELVTKRLFVLIYQQELLGRGSHIPCWIFVTEGMASLKQKEFVLAVRIENSEDYKKFPKPPIQLFMHLFKAVAQKKRFNIGSVIPLGEKGLMGYAGLGFTHELINNKDLNLPLYHLSCLFLTREELVAARTFGLSRVLARLGYEQNRFPVCGWNEMTRTGLPMKTVLQDSQVKQIASLTLEHSSVNMVNGEKIILILSPLIKPLLVKFLKEHERDNQFGFKTQLLPYHEGALTWLPSKDIVEMNIHPDSDGEVIAGSFIKFTRDEQTGGSMLEDGFQINLDSDAWVAVRNAMNKMQNISISPSNNDMPFELNWNTSRNTDVESGLNATHDPDLDGLNQDDSLVGKIRKLFKR